MTAEVQGDKIDRELEEIRASLVAQEHRFLRILYNYWLYRDRPREDKVRGASASALLWGLLPSAATSSTGAVAALGLYLAYSANGLLEEQNGLTRDQNIYLQQQIEIQTTEIYQTRKAALIGVLYDLAESAGEEAASRHKHSSRARLEAVTTLVAIEKERNKVLDLTSVDLSGLELNGADLSGVILARAKLHGTKLQGATLERADLSRANLTSADLRGANFAGALLEEVKLSGARHSEETRWPVDFEPGRAGAAPIPEFPIGEPKIDPLREAEEVVEPYYMASSAARVAADPNDLEAARVVNLYRGKLYSKLGSFYSAIESMSRSSADTRVHSPSYGDVRRAMLRFGVAHEKAANHRKRDMLFTGFINSLQPNFYIDGASEILWGKLERLEALDIDLLAKLAASGENWVVPPPTDYADEVATRLERESLIDIRRDKTGKIHLRAKKAAGKMVKFASDRPKIKL